VRGKIKILKANYWSKSMTNGWTSERRARQAKLIQQWRPWEKSTGPKTEAGKDKTSQNAYKGGTWKLLRELAAALREQGKQLNP
jgi:hypothetical protein